MENKSISPFQMRQLQILHIEIENTRTDIIDPEKLQTELLGDVMIHHDGERWSGLLTMDFKATDKRDIERDRFNFTMTIGAAFTYSAENTPEEKARFDTLLKLNGATTLLIALRGRVLTSCAALGMPQLLVPSIKLREFEWTDSSDVLQKNKMN